MIRAIVSEIAMPRPRHQFRALIAPVMVLMAIAHPVGVSAQQQGAAPQKESGVRWEGTSLRFGDAVRLDPRVRIQADFLLDNESEVIDDRFSWGSRRIGVEGEILNRVQFQIERAFQDDDDDDTEWRDVYADVRINRALQIRGGRFKLPFSLERTTSRDDLDFLQRASAVRTIAPARDTGVMVHGRLADRLVGYEVGMFSDPDGLEPNDDQKIWEPIGSTFAGRLLITPVRNRDDSLTRDLEFGVAFTRSTMPEGLHGVVGRTFAGDRFSERMHVNGQRTRFGVEGQWASDRVSIKGEVLQMTDQREGQSVAEEDLSNLVTRGAYITGVVRVLGERGPRGPAVDVAARFDRLSLGSGNSSDEPSTSPRADHLAPVAKNTFTFGGTWIVHRFVKVQINLIRENLVDSFDIRGLTPGAALTTVMRLQFAL